MDHLNSTDGPADRQRTLSAASMLAASDGRAGAGSGATGPDNVPAQTPASVHADLPFDDPYADVAAWVDGTMTDPVDREIFEGRLRIDPQLGAAVSDLVAFRSEMARRPAQEHAPLLAPANIVPFRAAARVSHWLLPLAAAAVVMLTVALSTVLQPSPRTDLADAAITLPPLAPELRTVRGTLAGDPDEPTLRIAGPLAPIVRELRPSLTWSSQGPAEGFAVQLERLSDGALVSSAPLPATARSWQPPAPLTPGAIYEWQVQAIQGGAAVDQAPKPPEPEARFQVLGAAAEQALLAQERAAGGSELALGMSYARAGLVNDAEAHWRAAGSQGERLRAKLRDAEKQAGYLR